MLFFSPYSRGLISEDPDNNNSLLVKISSEGSQFSFFFAGDLERRGERALLNMYPEKLDSLDSDVLKVGHHGGESSSSMEFILAISPLYSIISSDRARSYNHPSGEILKMLEGFSFVKNTSSGHIRCTANNLLVCYRQ
jgi:competence protein ComEC